MFMPLILGCVTVFISMAIQIGAVVFMMHYLVKILADVEHRFQGMGMSTYVISVVMMVLFIGHLLQVAIWAWLFIMLGEFNATEIFSIKKLLLGVITGR